MSLHHKIATKKRGKKIKKWLWFVLNNTSHTSSTHHERKKGTYISWMSLSISSNQDAKELADYSFTLRTCACTCVAWYVLYGLYIQWAEKPRTELKEWWNEYKRGPQQTTPGKERVGRMLPVLSSWAFLHTKHNFAWQTLQHITWHNLCCKGGEWELYLKILVTILVKASQFLMWSVTYWAKHWWRCS